MPGLIITIPKGFYAMETLFSTPVNGKNLRYDVAVGDIQSMTLRMGDKQ